jgi:hypothetical protein
LFGEAPDRTSVCHDELSGGRKSKIWPLVSALDSFLAEDRITYVIETSGSSPELDKARQTIAQNEKIKKSNMELLVALRNKPVIRRNETFATYYQSSADGFASHVIKTLKEPEIVREAWNNNPEKFPHFTAFVELLAYVHYDAQRNQNSSLDSNWLPDAEQLCFLVDVDAIVSPERGFMRRAFEIWCVAHRLRLRTCYRS